MYAIEGAAVMAALYLLLLARSAWKQGELRQFRNSLLLVAAVVGTVAGAVALAIWLDSSPSWRA